MLDFVRGHFVALDFAGIETFKCEAYSGARPFHGPKRRQPGGGVLVLEPSWSYLVKSATEEALSGEGDHT